MSSATIQQRKAALRKQVAAAVDALTDAEIQRQSRIITDKVLKHPAYQKANSVSIYLSFDKEVQTGTLVEDILKNGKTCYIPRFQKGIPEMEMIILRSLQDYNSLPVNKWNIKQPSPDDQRESVFDNGTLDLVLAPGQAFTKDGVRLGRGKGYYDKFLAKCFKKLEKRPTILGLAFKEQIVPEIPQTETDVVLDEVLFEDK
ncbi:5-formyltetrahydrofolate cyclo-ligase [Schistocerca americana]|uniref:5-formyltetrahydrofolate cyclo-ligase n=1 Tax=Schistocerca americana TaxID=7009 RepID=UPI001F4FEC4F|nr:5-formyltetrahydrofolate cyclo-ligase [Schistocerca americana]XP_049774765.1 5-formyltetrahydrofolate cyclo-ligase [Schistocerca cancellata]XP_049801147.1 5-formyltetrahydrofolate cyclo-ligase [Schistocerca nitens]XP_049963584.1 5-formyltetrahydrofolate cyclo-ligase [Schistocerca serialis cubense]